MDEGKLGRILSFEFTYRHNSCIDPDRRVGWKQTAEAGGGTWYDLGPHVVDLCHYLCGELSFVLGKSQIAYPTHLKADGSVWETDADEAFYVICGTGDGAMGTVTVSKLTQGANDELNFLVNGERGSLSFSLMDPNYLNFYDATAVGSPMGGVRGYTRIECVGRYPSPASGFPAIKAPKGGFAVTWGAWRAISPPWQTGRLSPPPLRTGLMSNTSWRRPWRVTAWVGR